MAACLVGWLVSWLVRFFVGCHGGGVGWQRLADRPGCLGRLRTLDWLACLLACQRALLTWLACIVFRMAC